MGWKEALERLLGKDETKPDAEALQEEIKRLTDANFATVGDLRKANQSKKDAETKLTEMTEILGAEGDDAKSKAEDAAKKLKELSGKNAELTKANEALTKETATLKRKTLYQDVSTKTGAAIDVLETLAKDLPVESITIDGDKVHIADAEGKNKKEFKAYAEENWKAFTPALFPASETTTPRKGTPPADPPARFSGGGTGGGDDKAKSLWGSINPYGNALDKLPVNK